eukprot:TRINITY_DN58318_c0_g1_i1.p1 TRINITY_DN58318_c0_g1~~TRINITY_DN58318_c0_g1_i1.p1  ORF type:complete len:646 (+),score=63.36 TRINITY_DN58318_c0_g1_i1:128-2065(+)
MHSQIFKRIVFLSCHGLVFSCRILLTLRAPDKACAFAKDCRRRWSALWNAIDEDERNLRMQVMKTLHGVRLVYTGSLVEAISWLMACGSASYLVHAATGGSLGEMTSWMFYYAVASGLLLFSSGLIELTPCRIDLICSVIVLWLFLRPFVGYESVHRYLMASGFVFVACFACSIVQIEFRKQVLCHLFIYGARLANIPKYFLSDDSGTLEPLDGILPVFVVLETTQCLFSMAVVFIAQRLCIDATRESLLRRAKQVELRSVIELVSGLCDSVVRLDGTGRILGTARRLAALLMKSPRINGQGLAWEQFEHNVLPEDRELFRDFLRKRKEHAMQQQDVAQEDYDCYDAAEALHLRLQDSAGLSFHVELFHVPYEDIYAGQCHLLSIRDVSNRPMVLKGCTPDVASPKSPEVSMDDASGSNPPLDLTIQRQVQVDTVSLQMRTHRGPTLLMEGYIVKFKDAIPVWSATSLPSTVFSRLGWEQLFVWLSEQRRMQQEYHGPEMTKLEHGAMSFNVPYLGQVTSGLAMASFHPVVGETGVVENVEDVVVNLKEPSVCRVVMARTGKHLTTPLPRFASEELTSMYAQPQPRPMADLPGNAPRERAAQLASQLAQQPQQPSTETYRATQPLVYGQQEEAEQENSPVRCLTL